MGDFVAPFFDGVVKGGVLIRIGQMRIGAVLDEESDDRRVPVSGCENQGCPTFPVACVGIDASLEEESDGFQVPVLTGMEKLFFVVHGDGVKVWIERVITGGSG